ncbi:MAG: response regulator [Spirochaetales bacterium]|nr:response regulator [Spirochaetales bacterium]
MNKIVKDLFQAPAACCFLDEKQNITDWNPAAEMLFSIPEPNTSIPLVQALENLCRGKSFFFTEESKSCTARQIADRVQLLIRSTQETTPSCHFIIHNNAQEYLKISVATMARGRTRLLSVDDISPLLQKQEWCELRMSFEVLIRDLSKILISIKFSDLSWIDSFLLYIMTFLNADRGFLFITEPSVDIPHHIFKCTIPVINSKPGKPVFSHENSNRKIDGILTKNSEPLVFTTGNGSVDNGLFKELVSIIGYNPNALFYLPVVLDNNFFGFYIFTALSKSFRWSSPLLEIFSHVSTITAARFDREGSIAKIKEIEQANETLQDKFLHSQRMDAIGRLAGGVAHDFNNILSSILGHAELILEDYSHIDGLNLYTDEIIKSAQRAASLTQQLLIFGKKQTTDPRPINPARLIADLQKMILRILGEDIIFSSHIDDKAPDIMFDQSQFDQVIMNLIVNAREAMPQGGSLFISVTTLEKSGMIPSAGFTHDADTYVLITIKDTGEGMHAETKPFLFEPFFTTKKDSGHVGLGLSTVYAICTQHGGYIEIESKEGQGTTVFLYIPAAQHNNAEAELKIPAKQIPANSVIMLVEDEDALRAVIAKQLKKKQLVVFDAESPETAIKKSREYKNTIDLLITDIIMPKMNGKQLYDLLKKERPCLKTLFISGYSYDVLSTHGIIPEEINFLPKPFSLDQLQNKIAEILQS